MALRHEDEKPGLAVSRGPPSMGKDQNIRAATPRHSVDSRPMKEERASLLGSQFRHAAVDDSQWWLPTSTSPRADYRES